MGDKLFGAKGRKLSGNFVPLPLAVLEHPNLAALSTRAFRLLFNLYGQYKPWKPNNGDLCASFSTLKKMGWNSNDQAQKARTELLKTGWIVQTRQGGLGIGPSLYAVTFQAIDECGGKLERAPTPTALGYWKLGYNPEINPPGRHTAQPEPPHGTADEAA